jgi:hypothetical protein
MSLAPEEDTFDRPRSGASEPTFIPREKHGE